ncbi:MAG: hypothetical protein ACREOO_15645 [bacterium]
MNENIQIAGDLAIADWHSLRKKISSDKVTREWEDAFSFYERRMATRYIAPIELIQNNRNFEGEGFAI